MKDLSEQDPDPLGEHVTAVRVGHGANCSSIGSVVDTLFASATVGVAVLAAVVAALRRESDDVKIAGPDELEGDKRPRATSTGPPDSRDQAP